MEFDKPKEGFLIDMYAFHKMLCPFLSSSAICV